MNAAKDLLKRAVELDSAQKYSEALICYEEGIQNLLRAIGGKYTPHYSSYACITCSPILIAVLYVECGTVEEKKDIRKKAEEYLARAEQLKQLARDNGNIQPLQAML